MIQNLKIALKKQQKLIALFLLTIFLPSLLLSIFGIRAIRNEHFRLVQQTESEQLRTADLFKAQVHSRLLALESSLRSTAQDLLHLGTDEDEKRRLLRERLGEDRLVDMVFLIPGDAGPVYPLFQGQLPGHSSQATSILDDEQQLKIKEAEHLEFVQKDYGAAATIYRQLMITTRDRNDQALLMSYLARNLLKLDQHSRAIAIHTQIQSDYPRSRTPSGLPIALVSGLEKARSYRTLGRKARSVEELLELYEDIVTDRWGLSEAQFNAYASLVEEAVSSTLTEAAAGQDREVYNEAYRRLRADHQTRIEKWKVIAVLERESLPGLKAKLVEAGSFVESPIRLAGVVGEKDLLVTAVMMPGRGQEGPAGLLGVKLCNEYLEGELLNQIAGGLGIDRNTNLAVFNLSRRLLHGTALPSGDHVMTAVFFEDNYPPWRVELADLDVKRSGFPEIRTSFYFWTILTLIVVLVFGVLLVARTVGHEMELLKVKSDFVSSVSHEFKTPLTSIKALTERLLEGKVRQPKKMREYFTVISQDAERLTRLVENLLDFSRIEEGRQEYELVKTDVAEWLGETVDVFRSERRERQVTVRTHIPDDVPDLYMDRAAMAQAVGNLLDNAAKFSSESRWIDLIVEGGEGRVLIMVKDYGIGVPDVDQGRIFEKFHQGKATPGHSSRGTGLGLTLVKHTIEAHGGSVSVESKVGEGSTFTLSLPIRENTERD